MVDVWHQCPRTHGFYSLMLEPSYDNRGSGLLLNLLELLSGVWVTEVEHPPFRSDTFGRYSDRDPPSRPSIPRSIIWRGTLTRRIIVSSDSDLLTLFHSALMFGNSTFGNNTDTLHVVGNIY